MQAVPAPPRGPGAGSGRAGAGPRGPRGGDHAPPPAGGGAPELVQSLGGLIGELGRALGPGPGRAGGRGALDGVLTKMLAKMVSKREESKLSIKEMHKTIQNHAPDAVRFEAKYAELKARGVLGLDRYLILVSRILDDPDLKDAVTRPSPAAAPPESPARPGGRTPSRYAGTPLRSPALRFQSPGRQPALARRSPVRLHTGEVADELAAIRARALPAASHNGNAGRPPATPLAPRPPLPTPAKKEPLRVRVATPGAAADEDAGEAATPPGDRSAILSTALQAARHVAETAAQSVRSPGVRSPLFSARPARFEPGDDFEYPALPEWTQRRTFMNGEHILSKLNAHAEREESVHKLSVYPTEMQELLLMDDLLYAFLGVEGRYIRVESLEAPADGAPPGSGEEDSGLCFTIDASADPSLRELVGKMLPICEHVLVVSRYVETRFAYEEGLVAHALAAAIKELLWDWNLMVAQLEHQLRTGRLTLQGMWFYCQPTVSALRILAEIAGRAAAERLRGAALLNLLHGMAQQVAGDSTAHELLMRLLHAASVPYLSSLHQWIYKGVVVDPYMEFMVEERKELSKESLSHDVLSTYWQQRYTLRGPDAIPDFLFKAAENILTTGKYLNAVRECGRTDVCVSALEGPIEYDYSGREIMRHVGAAFDFASQELLDHLRREVDFVGRLRSIKRFFLLDQGDFLVHFLDIAMDELAKDASGVSRTRVQRLLDMALKTSTAANDPYNDDLACSIERKSVLQLLCEVFYDPQDLEEDFDPSDHLSLTRVATGVDMFTLDYRIQWPLSLVVTRRTLTKYQLIFRHLFHCKHVERQLGTLWLDHQQTRKMSLAGSGPMYAAYLLGQQMMHFFQHLYNFMTFEALEPNWDRLLAKMQAAPTIDRVILEHEAFLDIALRECMLTRPRILKQLEVLKSIGLAYVKLSQEFLSFEQLEVKPTHTLEQSFTSQLGARPISAIEKLEQSVNQPEFLKLVGDLKESFQTELEEFITLLTARSEPHLLNLVERLDFNGFYGASLDAWA